MRTRIRQLALADESGIALIVAVLIMAILTVMIGSMLTFTSESSRDATHVRGDQQAYALAEAGLNQAVAQLASHYYDSSGTANNNSTVFASDWFTNGALKGSQQSPSSTSACTSSSTCMSWTLVSCAFSTPPAGCTTMGAAGIKQGTVVLRGTGTVPSPTAAGSVLSRTVTASLDVSQPSQLVGTPPYWQEIYAGAPATGGCDLSLGQGVNITAPLYVTGNLCLTSTATISSAKVNLNAFGWVWLRQQSTIGASSGSPPKVTTAKIAGGCSTSPNTQPTMVSGCTINQGGGSIWDVTPTTPHSPTAPTTQSLPSVNWAWAQNAQNTSSPAPSCTNGRSLTEANFALTPTASYRCTSALGSINYTYNAAGTSTLVVSGDVYFSGNLTIDTLNALVQYSGLGSFFVNGTITNANNSFICVKVASGSCDFANANNSASAGYWDATQSVLLLQSHGAITATNLRFQGGWYSDTSITLTGGNGDTQGPIVTPGTLVIGQQLDGSFPTFPKIQAGSLGTPPPPFTLGKTYGGTY